MGLNDKRLLAKPLKAFYVVVPRNRVELLTRGFSVLLSGGYNLRSKNKKLQLKTGNHIKLT